MTWISKKAMTVMRIVLICLILSILTDGKSISNVDLICVKPFDFVKNLVGELISDGKTEDLCKLGKDLENYGSEVKSKDPDQDFKLAFDFWKESTDELQDFECHFLKPKDLVTSNPLLSTENKDKGK